MTRTTSARLAGSLFLLYIAAGITEMVLFSKASAGEGTAAKLASIAHNATTIRSTVVLTLVEFLCAVGLGVTLYTLTRDQDRELALIALCCRASEGVIGAASAVRTLALVSIATASTSLSGADAAAAVAQGSILLQQGGGSATISATCFAIASTLFSYLFLRARSIPVLLAWLGVAASLLLVVVLPLELAGLVEGGFLVWMPMLVFEVTLAFWLIVKGVAPAGGQR